MRRFSLPRFAINHPHFTIVLALLMVVLGVYSYLNMPARLAPKIPAKTLGVVTNFPGMPAEEMHRFVTQPLEKRLQIAGDVLYTTGVSQEEFSLVVLYFNEDVDLNEKRSELKNLVDVVAAELPLMGNARLSPRIVRVDRQNMPVVQFAVTRSGYDRTQLKEFLDNLVVTQFQRIENVLAVWTFGGPSREIQVIVDRDQLAAYGLNIQHIQNSIDQSNLSRGSGPLIGDGEMIRVQVPNEYTEDNILERLPNLPLASPNGQTVYLRDVASVRDTYAEMYGDYFYNGEPAIWVGVQPRAGADFYEIEADARELADTLESQYPELDFQMSFSKARLMRLNDTNALKEFTIAVLLAGAVMLLFLAELGGTFIALAILPSAVAFGFFALDMLGFQRDFGIMMGLVFIVGKLVDDSVVVTEVVRRYVDRGAHPKIASIVATEEVQGAITIATLVFAVMLFPMTQMTGDMGSGFRSMTTPMIVTVLASLLLSLTLTPLMTSYMIKPRPDAEEDEEKVRAMDISERLGVFVQPVDMLGRIIGRMFLGPFFRVEKYFVGLVRWSLDHSWIVIAGGLATVWLTSSIYDVLEQEQMPLTDTSIALGYVRADPNITPQRMFEVAKQISAYALEAPEVIDIQMMVGKSPGWGQYFTGYEVSLPNEAMIVMNLTIARQERERTMWDIEEELRKKAFATIPDLDVLFLQPVPPTPVAGARAPVEVLVRAPDAEQVYEYGRKMMDIAKTQSRGLHNYYFDQVRGVERWALDIDEAKAASLGLRVKDIIGQTFFAINGGKTATFFNPDPMYYHSRILIRFQQDQRRSNQDLTSISIKTPSGEQIPLSSIATFSKSTGYDRLHSFNTLYAGSVLGYYKELGLKETTMSLLMPSKMQLTQPKGSAINPAGLMLTMLQAFNELNSGLKIALIAVYLLLVVFFRSFAMAIVLMLAIPLGGVGSLGALWLRDMAWSPPVLWGMVILAGIVLSNSILMVAKIEQLRRQGMPVTEAIPIASALRLRPVLMTAITTGIAMLPIAIAPPPATEQFRNIATAITGGLITSTMMTLIVIPVAYYWMHVSVTWVKKFYFEPNLLSDR
ncbi:MAG: efflux RND transporter permease subunit [Gammaproteobacteria bacterium]|nr:efflux RND transporter permease subunit [Gammaproteobacteria bacterium]